MTEREVRGKASPAGLRYLLSQYEGHCMRDIADEEGKTPDTGQKKKSKFTSVPAA